MSCLQIICVAYNRYIPLEILCKCFQVQTNPNWVLHVVYDGKAPDDIIELINPLLKDSRIHFYQSPERYQNYGHPNRKTMLEALECNPKDFIWMQNDDNYVIPKSVEFIINEIKWNTGIIYWNTLHSYMDYDVHKSELKENSIDMAAFAVRADIAKMTGFNHLHLSADGAYAEECLSTCTVKRLKTVKINKCLTIHN